MMITVPSQFTLSNDFLAAATARLGYSFVDRWLILVGSLFHLSMSKGRVVALRISARRALAAGFR
jgi:hypothetical protein